MVTGRVSSVTTQDFQKGRVMKKIALAVVVLTGGCASGPVIVSGPAPSCSSLIPAGWIEPVPSATLPAEPSDERDWMAFGVAQTGQLRTANGRTSDVVQIVTACERRDAEAIRMIERPWYRRLLPS